MSLIEIQPDVNIRSQSVRARIVRSPMDFSPSGDSIVESPARHGHFIWLKTARQVHDFVPQRRRQSVLLVSDAAVLEYVAAAAMRSRQPRGVLVLTTPARLAMLMCLRALFSEVVCLDAVASLEPRVLASAMAAEDACGRLIAACLDVPSGVMAFWRGNGVGMAAPLAFFSHRIDLALAASQQVGIKAAGRELSIGEAIFSADEIICAFDAEYRRWLRRRQWRQEQTLGSMIRCRRHDLGLRREEFPGIDAKTVARIERGEISRPQRETLRLIAHRLGLDINSLCGVDGRE